MTTAESLKSVQPHGVNPSLELKSQNEALQIMLRGVSKRKDHDGN